MGLLISKKKLPSLVIYDDPHMTEKKLRNVRR